MRLAIHQPQFFPYPGFFSKLSVSDAFVIMDDVQYDKRFTNRNKILAPQGPTWLSVPINKAEKFGANMEIEINNAVPWREEHWKKITYSYKNSKWFGLYRDYLQSLYSREHRLLFDLDLETTSTVMGWLGIDIPIVRESGLKIIGDSTQRLVNACRAMGADTYVSGSGARAYMDERLFAEHGIKVDYLRYEPSSYPQRFVDEFVPNLSILDMLFNMGADSRKLLRATPQADLIPG